jgi:hypothetical protein
MQKPSTSFLKHGQQKPEPKTAAKQVARGAEAMQQQHSPPRLQSKDSSAFPPGVPPQPSLVMPDKLDSFICVLGDDGCMHFGRYDSDAIYNDEHLRYRDTNPARA